MSAPALNLVLEKLASQDKDFRYMATSDLLTELSKPTFKTDPDTERRLVQMVLQQLDDAAGEISGLAVKWWAAILLASVFFWRHKYAGLMPAWCWCLVEAADGVDT